jgi:hypothetical protein
MALQPRRQPSSLILIVPVNTRNYNVTSLELISEMKTSPARDTGTFT